MIAFLVLQIRLGKITVGDVPDKYRAQVQAIIEGD